MNTNMHQDAAQMIKRIIAENMPEQAVQNALRDHTFTKNIYLVAIGKAAWTMAKAASDFLGDRLIEGIVITKYDHSQGDLPRMEIIESGHPTPDENTLLGGAKVTALAERLTADDELIFLVSGGGSALFESLQEGITLDHLVTLTNQLLASGADIVEINMIRKRLSRVKGGRFAALCAPASVFTVVLSDVLGDRLDSIASGPTAPDTVTTKDVQEVIEKYNLDLPEIMTPYLTMETPKEVSGVKTVITGSVRTLCESAANVAKELGYTPMILTSTMECEAREAGRFLASIAADTQSGVNSFTKPCAIIAGGETVVQLKGKGMGGRNQEIALSAASGIAGHEGTLAFSLGSDGTDGPNDAAGGIVDDKTKARLLEQGIKIDKVLAENDAYPALKAVDGLIMTGPTGTNVNDVTVILCK